MNVGFAKGDRLPLKCLTVIFRENQIYEQIIL